MATLVEAQEFDVEFYTLDRNRRLEMLKGDQCVTVMTSYTRGRGRARYENPLKALDDALACAAYQWEQYYGKHMPWDQVTIHSWVDSARVGVALHVMQS